MMIITADSHTQSQNFFRQFKSTFRDCRFFLNLSNNKASAIFGDVFSTGRQFKPGGLSQIFNGLNDNAKEEIEISDIMMIISQSQQQQSFGDFWRCFPHMKMSSGCQTIIMSVCQYVNMSICQQVYMSVCQAPLQQIIPA